MKCKFFVCILLILSASASAQTNAEIKQVADYVKSLQYSANSSLPSYGAFRKGGSPEISSSYYKVEPYFANIGVLGLLTVKNKIADETILTSAQNWMTWYVSKMNPLLVNYYYKLDGTGETTCAPSGECNDIDAQDSDPTVFFKVLEKYYEVTNSKAWFTNQVKYKLEAAADFVIALRIPSFDLTMAKTTYPVAYTMDNSEVYAGLVALANIEQNIYGDSNKSTYYLSMASMIKSGITTYVYPSTASAVTDYKIYALALTCTDNRNSANTTKIYSFAPALWPQLFGVDINTSGAAINARNLLDSNFSWTGSGWLTDPKGDGYWWTSLGYIASLSGDLTRGRTQAINALPTFSTGTIANAAYIGDAGWLLMNLQLLVP